MGCKYNNDCSLFTEFCTNYCPYYATMRLFKSLSGVPKIYENTYSLDCELTANYLSHLETALANNVGLYLYSNTSGNGKTLRASIIANNFIKHFAKQYTKIPFKENIPVLFVGFSTFQIIYSQQFREDDLKYSRNYYSLKQKMSTAEVLILDDVGIKNLTDNFKQEFYEVINSRYESSKLLIMTSNLSLAEYSNVVGNRIYSRLSAMTKEYEITGEDYRLRGWDN